MNEQMQGSQESGANPQPGPPNPPINLFAKAKREGKGVAWDLGFQNPPEQSKARVDLPKKSGAHEIVFHLVATQGLDIRFDTADPIWVCETGQCPPPKGINTDQITILSCVANLLRIRDSNDGPERILTYQLNFVGEDASPLDPEIKNGGTM